MLALMSLYLLCNVAFYQRDLVEMLTNKMLLIAKFLTMLSIL